MTIIELARPLQSPEHHPSDDGDESIMPTPLPFRDDTLLGVCQAIGDDLGFNPDVLRVILAASLLWDAKFVVLLYLMAGVFVALLRWLVPSRQAEVEAPAEVVVEHAPEPLPLAA